MKGNSKRRLARQHAVQILFAHEFQIETDVATMALPEQEAQQIFDVTYAKALIAGVKDKQIDLDAILQAYSPKRKLERMNKVDLTILRIALWELRFAPTPLAPAIAISEALELTKRYSNDESRKLVHAILDAIVK